MLSTYIPVLKIRVTPMTVDDVLKMVSVSSNKSVIIVGHNLHSVYLYHTNTVFRQFYDRADIILIDGQPIRWLYNIANFRNRVSRDYRVGSVDWITKMTKSNLRSIAVVGASPHSNHVTVEYLRKITGADVKGYSGVPWNQEVANSIVESLSEFSPELTIVGLGMPLQEEFATENATIQKKCLAIVGGAIDQISGVQRRAPRLLQTMGLEWFWRLSLEPKKFWRRYLVEPVQLLLHLCFQCGRRDACNSSK